MSVNSWVMECEGDFPETEAEEEIDFDKETDWERDKLDEMERDMELEADGEEVDVIVNEAEDETDAVDEGEEV